MAMTLFAAITFSLLGPILLKGLAWISATLSLRLLGRRLNRAYLRYTAVELLLATTMSAAFCFTLYVRPISPIMPGLFLLSGLLWLGYGTWRALALAE